jgi:hypothetical protein
MVITIFSCLAIAPVSLWAEPYTVQVAAGLRMENAPTIWMEPGVPVSAVPAGVRVSFQADRDCFLYVILEPDGERQSTILWPPLNTSEMKKVRSGEIVELDADASRFPSGLRKGVLSILAFSDPPTALHASIAKSKGDRKTIEREIRATFQAYSPNAGQAPATLTLIAGTMRAQEERIRGIERRADAFWGGVYEWTEPGDF